MSSAAAVAQHLIRLAAAEPEPERMTAMRLHKLLYYCQGWHLAWYGQPLFEGEIQAWKHGPVVREIYSQPWGKGEEALPDPQLPDALGDFETKSVDQVWSHFKDYSAVGLRRKSHDDKPWIDHYHPDSHGVCREIIPVEELRSYFSNLYATATGDIPGQANLHQVGTPLESLCGVLGW